MESKPSNGKREWTLCDPRWAVQVGGAGTQTIVHPQDRKGDHKGEKTKEREEIGGEERREIQTRKEEISETG